VRLDADHVGQLEREQAVLEVHVGAVAGIGQHHPWRHALGERGTDLRQRDLRLGGEDDLARHAGLGAPLRVVRPGLGQVEPIGDRQAGQRQADRDLTVVLLAEFTAVLSRHADRVSPLLGEAGVIHDPGGDGPERRQDVVPHRGQQRVVGPGGLGDEMVQRLVRGADLLGVDPGRHGLDTLALAGQDQTTAVGAERRLAIGMRQGAAHRSDVIRKPLLQRPCRHTMLSHPQTRVAIAWIS